MLFGKALVIGALMTAAGASTAARAECPGEDVDGYAAPHPGYVVYRGDDDDERGYDQRIEYRDRNDRREAHEWRERAEWDRREGRFWEAREADRRAHWFEERAERAERAERRERWERWQRERGEWR